MDVSIIIPTYNKRLYLEKTLQSLAYQKDAPEFEVIVVDDASTDDTLDWLETFKSNYSLRILRSPFNAGQGKARNLGVAEAKAPIIIFLDDDRLVNEEFVYQHLHSGGPGKIVLGERLEFLPGVDEVSPFSGEATVQSHTQPDAMMNLVNMFLAMFSWPLQSDAHLAWLLLATGNASVWRDDLLKVNGFDENFRGRLLAHEDTELGLRMGNPGNVYVYQPLARNVHFLHPRASHTYLDRFATWDYIYRQHPIYPVLLQFFFTSSRLSFWSYWLEANKNEDASPALKDSDLLALQRDCALADDIGAGKEVILTLAPNVDVRPTADTVTVLQPEIGQKRFSRKFSQGVEKEVLQRLVGQVSSNKIIRETCKNNQPPSSDAAKVREAIACLVYQGTITCV